MQTKKQKYPILISTIISCLVVIVSLFILGFCGMNLSVSLGGGSAFEIYAETNAEAKEYLSASETVLKSYGLSIDSSLIEDKYMASDNEAGYTRKCLIIKIAKKNISDEDKEAIFNDLVETLGISETELTKIETLTASTQGSTVLYIALGIAVVAVCFFVFGWLRYNVFAGLSFIIAYLHNIIFFLSLIILTRVQFSTVSLMVALILTLMMSVVMVAIYERFKEASALQSNEKTPVAELMISSEKQAVKPYIIICVAAVIVAIILMIMPSNSMTHAGLGVILALAATIYSTLIIGPGSYSAVLEIRDMNRKAIMSRNDKVNKHIKSKIKRSQEEKLVAETKSLKASEPDTASEPKNQKLMAKSVNKSGSAEGQKTQKPRAKKTESSEATDAKKSTSSRTKSAEK